MRPKTLPQVVQVALVCPPMVRMSSAAILRDAFTMAREHIRRQYGAIDVLPAADKFDVVAVRTLSIDGRPVPSACGQLAAVAGSLGADRYDVVAICDFDWDEAIPPMLEPHLAPWLSRLHEDGAIIAACGNGAGILAQMGLVNGRSVAAPLAIAQTFSARWPEVNFEHQREIVIDDAFVSSQGGAGDFAAALHLVEQITSRNVSNWLAAQWGLMSGNLSYSDPLMVRAEAYLQEHYSRPLTIEALAKVLRVDRRTLYRHCVAATGKSPMAHLHAIRMEAAKNMLVRTAFTIDRIAGLIGYADTSHFRALFRASTGQSPRDWRKTGRQSRMS